MCAVDSSGDFTDRPRVGGRFLSPANEIVEVAATWPGGCVLSGGCVVTASELVQRYKPECEACGAFHEPEYPHETTRAFRQHIRHAHGREAVQEDTFAHRNGLLRQAVITAHQQEVCRA